MISYQVFQKRLAGVLANSHDSGVLKMIGVRFVSCAVLCLAAGMTAVDATGAVQSYLNIPSIAGVDGVPGYAGAMSIPSLTITPHTLTVTKAIDAASPAIFLATAQGAPTGTVSTLLYNGAPGAQPDATLDFFSTLISSYQANVTTEEFSFNADNPLELYLEVPGIPGASNTPGHASVMRINSFTLTGNEFTIVKLQDSASDDLFLANAQGVQFADARLLLYDVLSLGNAPDAVLEFDDLLISASQGVPDLVQPLEQHTFSFQTLSQPVPEPGTLGLLTLGAMIVGVGRRRASRIL
jgi:type VI protein secretion system component Hcp